MIEAELKQIERSTYRAVADSGLWDVFIAAVVSMLAFGPLLSVHLGDFWSAAAFVPVFAVILLVIQIVKVRVIEPRIGAVEFSEPRRKRMAALPVVMLVVNVVALVLGIVVVTSTKVPEGPIVAFGLSMVILVGFTLASFLLQVPRVFFYGLLLAVAPLFGEALFLRGYASHHGYPIVFGVSAVVILVSGAVRFIRFLPRSLAVNGRANTKRADD